MLCLFSKTALTSFSPLFYISKQCSQINSLKFSLVYKGTFPVFLIKEMDSKNKVFMTESYNSKEYLLRNIFQCYSVLLNKA